MKVIDSNNIERKANKVSPDPDYPGFMKLEFRRHHEWMSIPEFLKLNPQLKHLTDNAPETPDDVVGVVTSAGKDYLRDSSKKWAGNAYLGMFIWISRGQGEGQKRTIVKNTHNQLTIDQPWDTLPNKTSQYVISYNVQKVKAMGNTLPMSDIKELERMAIKLDRRRGRLNENYKYLKPEEVD
jgi:hypothetical protein